MKGYIAWNYWDHKILARTPSWKEADEAVKKARKANPGIRETEFGIEAVENINANALNKNPKRRRKIVWTRAKRAAFARKMKLALLRVKNPQRRKRRKNPLHNIEKSIHGGYVGHATGTWRIRKANTSYGNWAAHRDDSPNTVLYGHTLKDLSRKLEAWNNEHGRTFCAKNPARRYRVMAGTRVIKLTATAQAALNYAKSYARTHRTARVRVFRT